MSDSQDWIGRQAEFVDVLRPDPARFLQATLGTAPTLEAGAHLPPLWHWLYCLEARPAGELGRDGHPRTGGFLPPVALPRRMWAGGRVTFHAPLVLGQPVTKRSTVTAVRLTTGRTGPLCFVTVEHAVEQVGRLALVEEQDLVYRADPNPGDPAPSPVAAPSDAGFGRDITPTEIMLFRYSALTFNGHRIHYDADYARQVEGYAGLVVHGPLIATLLIGLGQEIAAGAPAQVSYRGLAPISGPAPFRIEGRRDGASVELWARRHDDALAMTATLRLQD